MSDTIKLYLDHRQTPVDHTAEDFSWMEGADALVIDPCRCSPGQFDGMPVERAVILGGDPLLDAPWRERAGLWVCDQGLEATAKLRDLHPTLQWIPKLKVSRAEVSYRFSGPAIGEGFSFYMPDTSAIQGWRVSGSDLSFAETLERATALGFEALWLHSPDAASRNKGLDLDLLDKTSTGPWEIWLSGGIAGTGHMRNLARVGGAAAVVVESALAARCSLASLREALLLAAATPQAVPVAFAPRNPELGPH
ncbi:MAG: hypothetical protein P8166_09455 [Candidatus Thiodiazotropha sp.]